MFLIDDVDIKDRCPGELLLYMALSAKAIVTQTLNILRRDYDNDDGSISLIMNPSVDDGYESSVTFDSQ
ncbi:hypothetical protein MFLAVUS_002746 [Mucor flavus]|uniref:Uncharacterized protein n=1 Tax=Mucor flavus TaxID=439312 RepID=A0ABP9YR41_9FUNG